MGAAAVAYAIARHPLPSSKAIVAPGRHRVTAFVR